MDDDDIISMTYPKESVIEGSRLSKYNRMINMVVYCLRFRLRQRGIVTALVKWNVEFLILPMVQREISAEMFSTLEINSGKKVNYDLAKFSSFVDKDNIIHLKGQLSTAKKQ